MKYSTSKNAVEQNKRNLFLSFPNFGRDFSYKNTSMNGGSRDLAELFYKNLLIFPFIFVLSFVFKILSGINVFTPSFFYISCFYAAAYFLISTADDHAKIFLSVYWFAFLISQWSSLASDRLSLTFLNYLPSLFLFAFFITKIVVGARQENHNSSPRQARLFKFILMLLTIAATIYSLMLFFINIKLHYYNLTLLFCLIFIPSILLVLSNEFTSEKWLQLIKFKFIPFFFLFLLIGIISDTFTSFIDNAGEKTIINYLSLFLNILFFNISQLSFLFLTYAAIRKDAIWKKFAYPLEEKNLYEAQPVRYPENSYIRQNFSTLSQENAENSDAEDQFGETKLQAVNITENIDEIEASVSMNDGRSMSSLPEQNMSAVDIYNDSDMSVQEIEQYLQQAALNMSEEQRRKKNFSASESKRNYMFKEEESLQDYKLDNWVQPYAEDEYASDKPFSSSSASFDVFDDLTDEVDADADFYPKIKFEETSKEKKNRPFIGLSKSQAAGEELTQPYQSLTPPHINRISVNTQTPAETVFAEQQDDMINSEINEVNNIDNIRIEGLSTQDNNPLRNIAEQDRRKQPNTKDSSSDIFEHKPDIRRIS